MTKKMKKIYIAGKILAVSIEYVNESKPPRIRAVHEQERRWIILDNVKERVCTGNRQEGSCGEYAIDLG